MKDEIVPELYEGISTLIDEHMYERAMAEAALQQAVQLTRIADAVEVVMRCVSMNAYNKGYLHIGGIVEVESGAP